MITPADLHGIFTRGRPLALGEALLQAARQGQAQAIASVPAHGVQSAWVALMEAGRESAAATVYHAAIDAGQVLPFPNQLIMALDRAGDRPAAQALAQSANFPGPPAPWHFATRVNLLEWCGALEAARDWAGRGAEAFPQAGQLLAAHARLSFLTGVAAATVEQLAATALPLAPGNQAPLMAQLSRISRDDTLEIGGLTLCLPPEVISPTVARIILNGDYEAVERAAVTADLSPDDRLLDLGGGIGVIALTVAKAQPTVRILTVEANPELAPVIRRNFALNQCAATLVEGIAALTDGTAPFHLARDFWASSTETVEGAREITLATVDVNRLIRDFRPTILTMDIEGGEVDLLPQMDLAGLRRMVIEFHPEQTPPSAISATLHHLLAQGFGLDLAAGSAQVLVFDRADTPAPTTTPIGE